MESQQSDRKPKSYYVDYTRRNNNKFNNRGSGNSRFRDTPDISPGSRGFLLTTIDEVKSYIEMRNIFEGYFEELYKPDEDEEEKKSSKQDEDVLAEDELESELKKLKIRRPFKQVKTHCRNNVFINIVKDFAHIDPVVIVDKFFDEILEKREIRTSNTFKVLPILDTFPTNISSSKTSIATLLNNLFKDEISKKYFIDFQSRGNYKLDSDDKQKIIEGVADTVGEIKPGWSVDRENADYIITLIAFKNVCCVSILKDYFKRSKYNVNELCKEFIHGDSSITKEDVEPNTDKLEEGGDVS